MTTSAVIGASAGLGLALTRAALIAGHNVQALARSMTRVELKHSRLQPIAGDALNARDVAKAVTGADQVFITLGFSELAKGGAAAAEIARNVGFLPREPIFRFSQATFETIRAMREAGAKRLVVVTGIGAGETKGRGGFAYARLVFPLLLQRIYADKDRQEALVRKSGLDWTIVRPPALTHATGSGAFVVEHNPWGPRASEGKTPDATASTGAPWAWTERQIARADVALALLAIAQDPATFGEAVGLSPGRKPLVAR